MKNITLKAIVKNNLPKDILDAKELRQNMLNRLEVGFDPRTTERLIKADCVIEGLEALQHHWIKDCPAEDFLDAMHAIIVRIADQYVTGEIAGYERKIRLETYHNLMANTDACLKGKTKFINTDI